MKRTLFLFIFLLIASSAAHCADRYWVGGAGTWDSSTTTHWSTMDGGPINAAVPTSSDDVYFTANSGSGDYTVTTSGTINCQNLSIDRPAGHVITLAGSATCNVYGNMNYTGGSAGVTDNFSGTFNMYASSGSSGIITSNGVPHKSNFDIPSGKYASLGDAYTSSSGNFYYSYGTFNPNGQVFTLTGSTAYIGGLTFYDLVIAPSSPTKYDAWMLPWGSTISHDLIITGDATNRLLIETNAPGISQASITCNGTVSAANCDFQDIIGAGSASWDISAGNNGDCGGNTGITFTAPVDQHWTNPNGGNWSTAGNWTSRVPLPQDNVYMDCAFGDSKTVTVDKLRIGKNIDFTGATWSTSLTLAFSNAVYIFGSLILIDNLTLGDPYNDHNGIYFSGRNGSYTINTHSISLNNKQIFFYAGASGTYTLANDLSSNTGMYLQNGTLSANGYALQIADFWAYGGNIQLGSATHILSGLNGWLAAGGTVTAGTSTLKFTNTSGLAITFSGYGNTYNNVWFSRGLTGGNITISGSNTFNDLKDTGTSAHSLIFANGTTQTVSTFTVNGHSGHFIYLNSDTTATYGLTKIGGGTINCNYLVIQHSVATPANTWYANSDNSFNNQSAAAAGSGWIFSSLPTPPTYLKRIYVTSGTLWSANDVGAPNMITVECIGGGGSGGLPNNRSGGGGGEYRESQVYYVSGSVPIQIGQGGSSNNDGTSTIWNSGVIVANPGLGGTHGGSGGSGGTGTLGFNGGNGVSGTAGSGWNGGGGGGGAGGPNGAGANGGTHQGGGGGGGGNGGGSAGQNSVGTDNGADGGNNIGGVGHGLGDTGFGATAGTSGGGGGGGFDTGDIGNNGASGGNGTEWGAYGSGGGGGGGGGGGFNNEGPFGGYGGLYGGGGGGTNNSVYFSGGVGANGIIVITYNAISTEAGSGNFFPFF